ncbi:hypothetical protein [Spiroplasma endosymbiont of Polydrusus pterygomalis]|uniref:hypothetical protein n=1 Tax=Spiroplasma endosymbiont of Polydrusus pterygomalis TaxID=3139327 RepID=UPI003CCAE288
MKIGNNEVEIKNITNNNENVKQEGYELSNIISPIFGLHYQKLTSTPINIRKNNSSSITIKQDVDKKNQENIFPEKEVAYNNFSNLDNTRIAQNKKDKAQQQRYDSLSSHYLAFHEKIDKQNTAININNLTNSDTVITTIDLLIDDILNENK